MGRVGDLLRWIWGRVLRRPSNFGWLIPGKVAGSGRPSSRREVLWLKSRGIRAILTLTEKPVPPEYLRGAGLDNLHLPIIDQTAPSPEKMGRAIAYIEEQLEKERPIVVHCAAGQGRTGTILAAYLVKALKMDWREAIETVRRVRPGSVANEVQVEAVRLYQEALEAGRV